MNNLLLIALAGGIVLPIQAALNARLGRDLGNAAVGALTSFIVGAIALVLYMIVTRATLPSPADAARIPLIFWLGGILGAFYVAVVVAVTPRIGVATTMGLVVAGQIGASILLDHFGLLELPHHPVSIWRVLGLCMLVGGVVLIKRF